MRTVLLIAGLSLLACANGPAAAYDCDGGQMPAPPEVAARMALPLCGFAATKRWGPNGCQLCDARNMYPNPYEDERRPVRRGHAWRSYQ